jgi:selenocysteine lyase/cysteine desulfurase
MIDSTEISRLRGDTPGCSHRIHLNNAGAGLMPSPVLQAVVDHFVLESQIGGYEASDARGAAIDAAYESVAALIGTKAGNIAMVENATVGYQQALASIPFERGDVIVTSNNDYISNQLMFLSLGKRFGTEVVRIPEAAAGGLDVQAFAESVRRRRPRLVAVTHVPTNSGLIQPVEDVGRICRAEGLWYLVDACQSLGQLVLDVEAIGCDFLSATSRKFLRGPRGCGFLFASDRALQAGLEPWCLDMRGAKWVEPDRYEVEQTARRFENWEFAYALVLGTGAAADYASKVGMARIEQRTTELAAQLRGQLSEAGFAVLDRGARKSGIVTVALPGRDADEVHASLEKRGINSSTSHRKYNLIDFGEKNVEWALRLSPHYYNTDQELHAAVDALIAL